MKICILTDPLEGFDIGKDSTYAMMREAASRGHELHVFEQRQLACEGGTVAAATSRVQVTEEADTWYRRAPARTTPLVEFDAVLVRKDPPFDMEYVYATYLLEAAQRAGARVFNRPDAIRNHNEKLAILEFPQFTAPTLVSRDMARLRDFHAGHGDVIFKPLDGMGGAGIFRVAGDGMNLGAVIETLTGDGAITIMAQRRIPAIAQGDKRILVIGGRVVPYALARIPRPGEVRGNLAAGGRGEVRELTARDREIAGTLAPLLAARGLLLAGLDVIGDHLTEINVTSPTCFREIMRQSGFDVAGLFVDALESAVAEAA